MARTFGIAQTTTPASGTFDLTATGVGTCTGALILFSSCTVKNSRVAHNNYSIGAVDGTNQWSLAGWNRDAQTSDTYGAWSFVNTRCGQINTTTTSWSTLKSIQFSSFIADGVRLAVVTGAGTGYFVTALLFGGDNQVHVGTLAMNAQDVVTNYTGCSFQPAGITAAYGARTINTTGATNPIMILGGYDGTNQKSQMWYPQDAVYVPTTGVSCYSRQRSNRIADYYGSQSIEITSLNADGFTAYSRDGNAATFAFILTDCPMHVGNGTYATSGTEAYTGGVGTPSAAIEISTLISGAVDTTHTDSQADGWGISLYDATSQHSLWCKDDDGNTTSTDAGMYLRDDAVVNIYHGDDSAESRAAFSSFTPTGRVLTVSDYPAAALRYLTIQFLSGAGSAAPAAHHYRQVMGMV